MYIRLGPRLRLNEENDSQERVAVQLLVMKTLSVGRIIFSTVTHTDYCFTLYQDTMTFVIHESGIAGRVSEYRLMR